MPLSPPAPRKHLHTRRYHFEGFQRGDGLFDIEGRITDTKTYGFANDFRGQIGPEEPIHDMQVRLTLDFDFVIRDIEATTNAGPYGICGDIAPNYRKMIGERIKSGWAQRIKALFGRTHGCTHISEMLVAMGTVAFQTMWSSQAQRPPEDSTKKPAHLDSCHALATDGDIVKRFYPQFYTGERSSS